MQSIPLKKAMILWMGKWWGDQPTSRFTATMGKVKVVEHLATPRELTRQFVSSYGACNSGWRDSGKRLQRLFTTFNTLSTRDGIDPEVAHKAFLVIPEYRQAIDSDLFGATYLNDEGTEQLLRGHWRFSRANLEATR